MGLTDEWWEELEANEDLRVFIEDLAQETIDAVNPPPGLELFLARNGLGIIPLIQDRYEEKEEISHPKIVEQTPHFAPKDEPATNGFGLFDYVTYETRPDSRGRSRAGRGLLKKRVGQDSFEVDTGDIIDIMNDKVTLIRKYGD